MFQKNEDAVERQPENVLLNRRQGQKSASPGANASAELERTILAPLGRGVRCVAEFNDPRQSLEGSRKVRMQPKIAGLFNCRLKEISH